MLAKKTILKILASEARKHQPPKSELMRTLKYIIRIIAVIYYSFRNFNVLSRITNIRWHLQHAYIIQKRLKRQQRLSLE
jgi:hypothetical protein